MGIDMPTYFEPRGGACVARSAAAAESGARTRVLIFDDDPGMRRALLRILTRRGCEVFAFPKATPCMKCFCQGRERCVDVILSDISMPEVRGVDFIENQRRVGCRAKQFGLMSGDWSAADRERAELLGCRLFEKPINLLELV